VPGDAAPDSGVGGGARRARRERWGLEPLGPLVLAGLPDAVRRNLPGWRGVLVWADAVSPDVARRSRAVRFREGRLTVEVAGSVWLHHLTALKRQLVAQVNRAVGSQAIEDIIFVVNPGLTPR